MNTLYSLICVICDPCRDILGRDNLVMLVRHAVLAGKSDVAALIDEETFGARLGPFTRGRGDVKRTIPTARILEVVAIPRRRARESRNQVKLRDARVLGGRLAVGAREGR